MDWKHPYLLALLSGILCILSFPPFDFSFLIWIALIPLLYIIFHSDRHITYIAGLIFSIVFYYGTLYWIVSVFSVFGLILIFILCLIPVFFSVVVNFLRKLPGFMIYGPMVIWTALEFFRSEIWWLKFSWMNLGYSQHDVLLILQFASIFGQYGLSLLIVFVNSCLLYAFVNRKDQKKAMISLIGVVLTLTTVIGYGSITLDTYDPDIDVALIQDESSVFSVYNHLIEQVSADIILLPEYSIPKYIDESPDILSQISEITQSKDAYLIAGGKDRTDEGQYNTAYVFDPQGDIIGTYYKMNPIQFFDDGLPGTEFSVHETAFGPIGVLICYDMDYSYVSRNLVKNGATILFIPTYDAMRWTKVQHKQHSAMTSMRAVENGRFIARTATSGISQIIDPNGRITHSISIGETRAEVGQVESIEKMTFYTQIGWMIVWVCIVISIGLVLLGWFLFKKKS